MTTQSSDQKHNSRFPIVGRDTRIDLSKYIIKVRGQDIVDYEKLKADNPALYKEIVANEFTTNQTQDEGLREALDSAVALDAPSLLSAKTPGQPAKSKYFYIPVFVAEPTGSDLESRVLLLGNGEKSSPTSYASRVMPRQTLRDAIAADLKEDFNYIDDFKIIRHRFYDITKDQQGNSLPRLLVEVAINKFAENDARPLGMTMRWVSGQAILQKLGLMEWIPDIPFDEFFDKEKDGDFIESFEVLKSKKLNYDDTLFFAKNNKDNKFYAIVETEHEPNWGVSKLTELLGTDQWKSEQIKPLYKNWYATHYFYRITFSTPREHLTFSYH